MPLIQVVPNVGLVDADDARLGICIVGQDPHLATGIASGLDADIHQRHRQQADGHLLAGGRDDIQLARGRIGLHLLRQGDQAVGLSAHGGDHHHDLMALRLPARHASGHVFDPFGRTDRGAPVFLNYQCHVLRFF